MRTPRDKPEASPTRSSRERLLGRRCSQGMYTRRLPCASTIAVGISSHNALPWTWQLTDRNESGISSRASGPAYSTGSGGASRCLRYASKRHLIKLPGSAPVNQPTTGNNLEALYRLRRPFLGLSPTAQHPSGDRRTVSRAGWRREPSRSGDQRMMSGPAAADACPPADPDTTGFGLRRTSTLLDTTQTSCTHDSSPPPARPADPVWIHRFRRSVAEALEGRWPTRAARIRECGESAVVMLCADCGARHLFPVRCAGRTCPICARRGAAALSCRLLERIRVHDLTMECEPWDGPGRTSSWSGGDLHGRSWKLVTLTSPAPRDSALRFEPEHLRTSVTHVRAAVGRWWRSTPWGRQKRDPASRRKRVRRDTSCLSALEVAPGGMVHVHALVYGEYVPHRELSNLWGSALGLEGPAVVDIRTVDASDPTKGIREALKYATKGIGGKDQGTRAAAVEYAFRNVHRVSISGALRSIQGRSTRPDVEDPQGADLHASDDAVCEACGVIGSWQWDRIVSHGHVQENGSWGVLRRAPP